MKRSKPRSSGSGRFSGGEEDSAAWSKPIGPEPSWSDIESKPDEAFLPFALSMRYSKGNLILHPKFGKGLVVEADATRIEVLFQEGKKKLGHAVT